MSEWYERLSDEQIAWLKSNRVQYRLLTPAEATHMSEVPISEMEYYYLDRWHRVENSKTHYNDTTYRLRPDWERPRFLRTRGKAMKPSPRPWGIMQTNATCVEIVCDADNNDLCRVDGLSTSFITDQANADHIVRCVNLHDELVSRLEAMCDLAELQGGFDDEDGMRSIARSRETLEKARKADA